MSENILQKLFKPSARGRVWWFFTLIILLVIVSGLIDAGQYYNQVSGWLSQRTGNTINLTGVNEGTHTHSQRKCFAPPNNVSCSYFLLALLTRYNKVSRSRLIFSLPTATVLEPWISPGPALASPSLSRRTVRVTLPSNTAPGIMTLS